MRTKYGLQRRIKTSQTFRTGIMVNCNMNKTFNTWIQQTLASRFKTVAFHPRIVNNEINYSRFLITASPAVRFYYKTIFWMRAYRGWWNKERVVESTRMTRIIHKVPLRKSGAIVSRPPVSYIDPFWRLDNSYLPTLSLLFHILTTASNMTTNKTVYVKTAL